MKNRITRRAAASALVGVAPAVAVAAPQQSAKSQPDPLEQARKDVRETAQRLGEFKLEMSTEPAFVFRP
jgi:hypothetical protein